MKDLVVELRGLDRVLHDLDSLKLALDVDRIADEASGVLLNRIRQRFLKQVSPDGTPWVPTRAAMRRQREGRGGGTLFDTGALFHAISAVRSAKGLYKIWVDPNVRNPRTGGRPADYGRKYQKGEGVVQRKFLGFSKEDRTVVSDIVRSRVRNREQR